jgi:transcription initiation factor TFIIIB Brf1 subunit/transcription initiation factor TFIIB
VEVVPKEAVVVCKDGSRKHILWGFKTMGPENWAFGLDLTARKQAESAIVQQLDELRRWQEVMLDREDRVQELKQEVNQLAARLGLPLKYPSQAAAGQK